MATVGQALTAPEAGWQRINSDNSNIVYTGSWLNDYRTEFYNGDIKYSFTIGDKINFNFYGTKLRIISKYASDHTDNVAVTLDGVSVGTINEKSSVSIFQVLDFEVQGLENKLHTVELKIVNSGTFSLDAIDIDADGEIRPWSPSTDPTTGNQLLRVTMIDSSEREYELSADEINGFVTWFNRTVGTGTTAYVLNKLTPNTKEYLAFDKIISFEIVQLAK